MNAGGRRGACRAALLGSALLAGAGCEPRQPTAPPLPRPPPPPFTAVFSAADLQLAEGETATVTVRYRINDLAEGVPLRVLVTTGTAGSEDYEVSRERLDLPAGRGISGEGTFSVTALEDRQFAEGEETLSLRLVPPAEVGTRRGFVGTDLRVGIADSGFEPCPGIRVRATPPAWLDAPDRWASSTLDLEWSADARDAGLDFLGPYGQSLSQDYNDRFWINLVSWRMERTGGGVRHVVDLEWPAWLDDLGLLFPASANCSGETVAVCSIGGCDADSGS